MSQTMMVQGERVVTNNVQFEEDFFVYTTGRGVAGSFAPIAPNATEVGSIQIEADSYFKIIKGTFFSWVAGTDPESTDATRPIPPLFVNLVDNGSGRRLTNNPTPIASFWGDGRLPFIWPIPRIFLPRSSISFEVTNLSATDTWELTLDLIGVKGYKQG